MEEQLLNFKTVMLLSTQQKTVTPFSVEKANYTKREMRPDLSGFPGNTP